MKKLLTVFALLLTFIQARSQEVEMAADLRSSGKIYVVIIVIAVIYIGLLIYLFAIDKRLKKLENKD